MTEEQSDKALFGAGCFWGVQYYFDQVPGVTATVAGYSGGQTKNPTYEEVSSGRTGHAEVIEVRYDPEVVRFRDILTVFFGSHDPTTLNRQGADVGTQYRSVVFYTTPAQQQEAASFIKEIDDSNSEGAQVVTTVEPLRVFYEAEDYHKNYAARNKESQYCQLVINPKLEKVQQKFAALLKHI